METFPGGGMNTLSKQDIIMIITLLENIIKHQIHSDRFNQDVIKPLIHKLKAAVP